MIGIAVITPFGLVMFTPESALKASVETAAQFAAILVALLLVFNLSQEQELQLFYILFLPIVWLAVRAGLSGVTAGILVAQLGSIVGVHVASKTAIDVTAFQLLMLVWLRARSSPSVVAPNFNCVYNRILLTDRRASGAWVNWQRRSPMRSISPLWQPEPILVSYATRFAPHITPSHPSWRSLKRLSRK
jgi:hypothetical protein